MFDLELGSRVNGIDVPSGGNLWRCECAHEILLAGDSRYNN
jgi:hypothetical protein